MVQSIPQTEGLLIGGDFNGHIGSRREGYEVVHGGFGYSVRNSGRVSILDFAVAYELSIVNSYFKKREQHLISLKVGALGRKLTTFL